jgi:hypothetical protein
MTHWDPGMYPDQPIPLIQELVINLLAYGHVEIKDVDLFMNEQIVSYLSQPARDGISNWDLFASLVRTKRIIVLTPDMSRRLSPNTPTYSAARDHAKKRGHAGKPWLQFNDSRKAYCRKLDRLLLDERAFRARQSPPSDRNSFAELLYEILTSKHKEWRARDAFRHISPANEELFASFCVEPAKAVEFLEVTHKQRDIVNRDQGFFRTRLYQCASQLNNAAEQWSFENLAQTVYFANELDRERSAGSYAGRLAECPNPYVPPSASDNIKVLVEPRMTPGFLEVLATPDLGDVISETLRETGGVMREFWHAAERSRNPEQEFANAWNCVADTFGAANARYASERRRRLTSYAHWEKLGRTVECVLLKSELAIFGFKLLLAHSPNSVLQGIVEGGERVNQGLMLAANSVQVVGETTEDWIRSGWTETRVNPKSRDALLAGGVIRSSVAPKPVNTATKRNRRP